MLTKNRHTSYDVYILVQQQFFKRELRSTHVIRVIGRSLKMTSRDFARGLQWPVGRVKLVDEYNGTDNFESPR